MARQGRTLEVVDLFCGAGLLSAGFVDKRTSVRLALDLDEDSARSYARNVAPVSKVGSSQQPAFIKADILIAGPPCQGFSTLGRRDPKDVRNALCSAIPLWARSTRARVVVVENVPPFVRSRQWSKMVDDLDALGFDVSVWTLNAATYGVPQIRERTFTIASRIGTPKRPNANRETVPVDGVFGRVRHRDPLHVWPVPSDLALRRFRKIPRGGDWRDVFAKDPRLCPASWFELGCNATDIWGRVALGRPSNTIRCRFQNPSQGRYIHPFADRVLSLREGARIQGVPDSWLFEGSQTSIARQIGNGVPIPLARAVARSVKELFS